MSWQVSLGITVILIFMGLIFKNNKKVWYIQIIWMWILMACNTGGPDYDVHVHYFKTTSNGIKLFSSSWLYSLICYIFNKIGFDFFYMNMTISTILILIVSIIIKKNTKNVAFATSLFFIFPLADSIIQKRNFLADVILTYGICGYVKKEDFNIKKLLIIILIAAQVHSSFYFYIILLPFLKMSDKKFSNEFPIVLIIAFSLMLLIPKIAVVLIGNTSIASKIMLYFNQLKIPFYQTICWWTIHLIFTFLFEEFYKDKTSSDEKLIKVNNEMIRINRCLLIFMPLYYYEATFFRIFRNVLLINYIVLSKNIEGGRIVKKNKFYFELITIGFIIFVFLSQFVFFGQGFDKLIMPLLVENSILG